ncbi:MAG: hypothetical protein ABSG46_02490, partial [Candidatus Binataceae bacterium]
MMPILLGLGGRAIIVILIALSVWFGAMPFVLGLLTGILIIQFVLYEVFADSVYRVSRNLALIALVESAWLAWTLGATMPITFAF